MKAVHFSLEKAKNVGDAAHRRGFLTLSSGKGATSNRRIIVSSLLKTQYQYPMNVKRKEWTITIEKPLEEVWDFFAYPENLEKVTPEEVAFETLTDVKGQQVYPGMLIEHRIAPILGIKLGWITEIKHVEHLKYFVDEQRFGPYAMWHHQHHFEAVKEGTQMTDILHYKVPYGPIGSIANGLFVEKMIHGIFDHRKEAFDKVFA